MLVLSRKKNESVVIGDQVCVVSVVEIRGDKVRLGFEAPKEVSVHRREVYEAIQRDGTRPTCPCGNTLRTEEEQRRGTCGPCFNSGGL